MFNANTQIFQLPILHGIGGFQKFQQVGLFWNVSFFKRLHSHYYISKVVYNYSVCGSKHQDFLLNT